MLSNMLFFAIGLVSASSTVWIARKYALEGWAYTSTIFILPLIYALFALLANSFSALKLELIYGLPFFTIAALSTLSFATRSGLYTILVGIAWLAHGLYDVYHEALFANPGVYFWYPKFCAGYDLGIGAYLLHQWRRLSYPKAKRTPV